MEILNAYDLTGSYRAAAELCGCSHHTVKKAVEDRNAGLPPATRRPRMIDGWRDVLEGWVADSKGKIRGDKAHERLLKLGYTGTVLTLIENGSGANLVMLVLCVLPLGRVV